MKEENEMGTESKPGVKSKMDMKKKSFGRNPILPLNYHIPDCEARVMPDGRLYLFGSCDKDPSFYCSEEYQVFSTDDMIHWRAHGKSFDLSAIPQEDKQTVPDTLWLAAVNCFEDIPLQMRSHQDHINFVSDSQSTESIRLFLLMMTDRHIYIGGKFHPMGQS